jgi:4-hydroxybutyryl-CoA dehydratase/vinylacetyl-CoA-Delta-isomerase
VELVERLLERGIAGDTATRAPRAITQNRQAGRCCDSGCTTPRKAMMIDLDQLKDQLGGRNRR